MFEAGRETLAANLDRYDTGYWSRGTTSFRIR